MMTPELVWDKTGDVISELRGFVERSAESSERADLVERGILDQLLSLGAAFMQAYFELVGDGDVGETWERNGSSLKREEDSRSRTYHSIFGRQEVVRRVYAIGSKQKAYAPLDARLGLPEGEHSYVLEDILERFCVKNPFGDGVQYLKDLLGRRVSKLTAEKLNQKFGQEIAAIRKQSQAKPLQDPEAELLVVSVDGKGVPMCGTVEQKRGLPETPMQKHLRKKREQKAEGRSKRKLPPGHGKTHKQMAWLSVVYSIDAFPRTADEVLDELKGHRDKQPPRPINKHLRAQMTDYIEGERINGQDMIFEDAAVQIRDRNPHSQKTVICLMDGQCSLWDRQATFLPDAIPILDIFHVSEKLWEAAYCFHKQGSIEADKFVERNFRLLLEGKVGVVLRSLRAKLRGLKATAQEKLHDVIRYFNNNQQLMKYDEYLKQGYPIASGVIEGGCRHLVKDRMERTGMRWQIDGAQAMLNTRTAYINGEWDDMIEERIQRQQVSLYAQAA